ncbi:hypothetical protein ABKN59_011646 [Abortiporus biennis]
MLRAYLGLDGESKETIGRTIYDYEPKPEPKQELLPEDQDTTPIIYDYNWIRKPKSLLSCVPPGTRTIYSEGVQTPSMPVDEDEDDQYSGDSNPEYNEGEGSMITVEECRHFFGFVQTFNAPPDSESSPSDLHTSDGGCSSSASEEVQHAPGPDATLLPFFEPFITYGALTSSSPDFGSSPTRCLSDEHPVKLNPLWRMEPASLEQHEGQLYVTGLYAHYIPGDPDMSSIPILWVSEQDAERLQYNELRLKNADEWMSSGFGEVNVTADIDTGIADGYLELVPYIFAVVSE